MRFVVTKVTPSPIGWEQTWNRLWTLKGGRVVITVTLWSLVALEDVIMAALSDKKFGGGEWGGGGQKILILGGGIRKKGGRRGRKEKFDNYQHPFH